MTTAFVLTGGGSLGAVQVGMLQALVDVFPFQQLRTDGGAQRGRLLTAEHEGGVGGQRPHLEGGGLGRHPRRRVAHRLRLRAE
jgi:hypothetical protein